MSVSSCLSLALALVTVVAIVVVVVVGRGGAVFGCLGTAGHGGEEERGAVGQGRTLVHFLAQIKRFLWDRGSTQRFFRWCSGGCLVVPVGIRRCLGCILGQKRIS